MRSGEFCVVCGRTGRELVDGVCAACAAERTVLVGAPARVEVVLCPQCGARRVGARWERSGAPPIPSARDLMPFLSVHPEVSVREVRWEEREVGRTVREMVGHARVVFRGIERTVDIPLSVRTVARTCTDCGRRSGRYYTARLQLRGPEGSRTRRPRELKAQLVERWEGLLGELRADVRRAISWTEELPEGWDVYLTDTLAARAIARLARQRFGAGVQESASLFGRKQGQDVYRVTFCVRFPGVIAPVPRSRPPEEDAGPLEP